MTFGPQKNEIYDSGKQTPSRDIDPIIKLLVIVVVAVGCTAVICATMFGHNWTPPQ